jgi:hypothetical protein
MRGPAVVLSGASKAYSVAVRETTFGAAARFRPGVSSLVEQADRTATKAIQRTAGGSCFTVWSSLLRDGGVTLAFC